MTTSPLKVEDSRADFEAWHNSAHRWKIVPTMRTDDGYTNNIQASNGWAAWQASRSAIVVELDKCNCDNGEESVWDDAIEYCEVTLRSAGITVKGD